MRAPSYTIPALLLFSLIATQGCGSFTYDSLDEIEPVHRGETTCSSDDDCIATFHCSVTVTCSHTQDQPYYTADVCREPNISNSLLDECACREELCRWPE